MARHRRLRATVVALVLAVLGVGTPAPALADGPAGSISGTVVTPPGVDPGGIEVRAVPISTEGTFTALTAPDGTYTISGVPDGKAYVTFLGQSRGLAFQYWPDSDGMSTAALVTVAGGAVTGIDAHLYLGASLSGTIRTTSDCDLGWVRVVPERYPTVNPQWGDIQPDGRWTLTALPAGTYTLTFDGRYAGLAELTGWVTSGSYAFTLAAGESRTGIDVTMTGPAHGCVAPEPYTQLLYRDLLGRESSIDETALWARSMVAGTTREWVANAITSSTEFRTRLLDDTYQEYLGRGTDPSGLAYWLGQMRLGRPIEAVHAGFIASDEFYATSGGTPEGWVRGLYATVLDREPSQPEVDWWVAAIGRGMNRGTVAGGFLYSTEHLTTVVDGYYQWLLRRHIDPVGARDWVARIQQGYRDEVIIAGIVSSPEYATHVPRRS